ncbi:MAG: hypothetical protein AB1523_12135 [Bacillota bacterium]
MTIEEYSGLEGNRRPEEEKEKCQQELAREQLSGADQTEKKEQRKSGNQMAAQVILSFSDLPDDAVKYFQQSIVPQQVIDYYKQFGLDEETIKLLFHAHPLERAAHKPAINLPASYPGC